MTEAVEIALRERLDRERQARGQHENATQASGGRRSGHGGRRRQDGGGNHRLRRRWPAALTESAHGSLVVDTSAAVAIVLGEPGSDELAAHLEELWPGDAGRYPRRAGDRHRSPAGPAGQDVVSGSFATQRSTSCRSMRTGRPGDVRLAALWQRTPSGGAQFRRLLHVSTGGADRVSGAVQEMTSPRRISAWSAPGERSRWQTGSHLLPTMPAAGRQLDEPWRGAVCRAPAPASASTQIETSHGPASPARPAQVAAGAWAAGMRFAASCQLAPGCTGLRSSGQVAHT